MPFNTVLVASTAAISADLWQQVACLPDRVTNDQLLDLFIGLPLRQLGRWALYLWTYLCVSPTYSNTSFSEDSDSNSDEGSGGSGTGLSSSSYHRDGLREYRYSSSSSHSD